MAEGSSVRFRLHRPKELIKQNLKPLKENNKKKVAQEFYYQKHSQYSSPLVNDFKKKPVHQRLGFMNKRNLPLGTSTSSIMPKRRVQNKQPLNTVNNSRTQKLFKTNIAQARLERIRKRQAQNKSKIKLRRLQPKNFTVEVNNPNYQNGFDSLKRFKMILDPKIQGEIAEIQNENPPIDLFIHSSYRVTPASTRTSINERFSNL